MLFGFTGIKQAGKDTAARFLSKHIHEAGRQVIFQSFAAPIKDFFKRHFGITDADKEKVHPVLGLTGRKLFQLFGTEVGRNIHPDLWIAAAERKITNGYREGAATDGPVHIFTDVRFDNEARMIKAKGGVIIHILPGWHLNKAVDNHVSENGISSGYIDYSIENSGNLHDLESAVRKKWEEQWKSLM